MEKGDEDIIKRFAQGDERAFRVLYDRYAAGLRYFASKYVDDDAEIEDIVQDAFVALWEKRADFREETPRPASASHDGSRKDSPRCTPSHGIPPVRLPESEAGERQPKG